MILTVNGEPRESASANLIELWRAETEHLNLDSPKGYAIALNGALIRKDQVAKHDAGRRRPRRNRPRHAGRLR